MQEIIDVAGNVGALAARLVTAGVKTVIRYYNHRNVSLPTKCLTPAELRALRDAGLSVAVVFEQRSGAPDHPGDAGHIEDFGAENGTKDAKRALELAGQMEQPNDSAIYFAVDFDFMAAADLDRIAAYFQNVKNTLAGNYLAGVYGSGLIGQHLRSRQLVDHMWLAGARRWSGFDNALQSSAWSLFQRDLDQKSAIGNFHYDGNIANPSFDNFGQFGIAAAPPTAAAALFKVTARSGLNLRAGPDETFKILQTLPNGTIITGKGLEGPWMQVDLEGDGHLDGFMFARFLAPVSGGFPLPAPPSAPGTHRRPIDVAHAELDLDVKEIPGARDNPRIVLYHSTTRGGAASDETAWCSSFVNYCVEQAGFQGTDNKGALSWEDWGQDATRDPAPGDIPVFRRRAGSKTGRVLGGHVGFLVSEDESKGRIQILGGNQSDRIRISAYPRDGMMGDTHYKLLSIRRA